MNIRAPCSKNALVESPSYSGADTSEMGLFCSESYAILALAPKRDNKPVHQCRASSGYDDDCIYRQKSEILERFVEPMLARFPSCSPQFPQTGANKMGLLFSQKAMLSLAAKWTTNQIVHVGQARATTMTASAASQSWLDFPVADPSSRRPGANKMGLLFSQKASYAVPCCKMDNKPERP